MGPMNNLIPHEIADHTARGEPRGTVEGSVLFVNIVGFHRLAEALIPEGTPGQEKLQSYLQASYPEVSEAVCQRGGEILTFKGNAVTVFFPGREKIPETLYASMEIRRIFQQLETEETPQGKLRVYTRMGAAYGELSWAVLNGPSRKSWIYRGEALQQARAAEYWGRKNEIILDASFQELVDTKEFILRPVEDQYQKLAVANREEDPVIPGEIPQIPREITEQFYPDSVIDLPPEGSVQEAVLLMASFSFQEEALPERAETFLQIGQNRGGLCESLETSSGEAEGLLVFGCSSSEDCRREAMEAAVELREVLGADLRAAIHQGRIYLTHLGNPSRCGFCLLGDQVSLAGQLMQKCAPGETFLLSTTAEGLSEDYSLADEGKHQFKRMGSPLPVLRLEGRKGEPPQTDRSPQVSPPDQPDPEPAKEPGPQPPPEDPIRSRIEQARSHHQGGRPQEALQEIQLARQQASQAGRTDLLREILPLYIEFIESHRNKGESP